MKQLVLAIFLLGFATIINAQMHGDGNMNPDSLNQITISGTAIVVESTMNFIYYIDINSDGTADYHLNFGPNWYNPDSSLAKRPLNGDFITVIGGVHDSFNMTEQTIIVYELNGEFWRNPFFADWNNMGKHNHQMGNHHDGGMMGYGFGWEHNSVITTEFNGTAIVDTTFYMNQYYLDVNNDSIPDYFLNFGPYWYEAESGAAKPINGENISIKGGLMKSSMTLPMFIVYEINGLTWRDSTTIGKHFGGGWVNVGMTDSIQFHSPFDSKDHMTIRNGWNNQGSHHGGGMNNFDSLFCQILEIYPENIPNFQNMNILAGYEIDMFDPNGASMMRNGDMMGGHMEFGSKVGYQLHYTDKQLENHKTDENSLIVKYWDNLSNTWLNANASVNTEANLVTFENNVVSNYIVLSFNKVTAINVEANSLTPNDFNLEQNYPNPFNPTTVIQFTLSKEASVTLNIYNVLGEKVSELLNKKMGVGSYNVNFNAKDLPSGVYFYELNTGFSSIVKKMSLLK
ncbi:MAG: T9SS type A sorting domain-containing protein [Ignavibacteriae bacterium]|nr:T9SS type A sorting domain-containing protein [Ignavibacteriota bacterium]